MQNLEAQERNALTYHFLDPTSLEPRPTYKWTDFVSESSNNRWRNSKTTRNHNLETWKSLRIWISGKLQVRGNRKKWTARNCKKSKLGGWTNARRCFNVSTPRLSFCGSLAFSLNSAKRTNLHFLGELQSRTFASFVITKKKSRRLHELQLTVPLIKSLRLLHV